MDQLIGRWLQQHLLRHVLCELRGGVLLVQLLVRRLDQIGGCRHGGDQGGVGGVRGELDATATRGGGCNAGVVDWDHRVVQHLTQFTLSVRRQCV